MNFLSFCKTTKYEFVRLFRNKFLLSLLVIFSVILVVLISRVGTPSGFTIAFFANGQDMDESRVVSIIEEYFDNNNTIIVNSIDEGKQLVARSEARLFISINVDTSSETAVVYYDSANPISNSVIAEMGSFQNSVSYEAISELLAEFGIVVNEDYFKAIDFQSIQDRDLSGGEMSFANSLTTAIAIVVMFGISYAISRDNETNVSRNLSYLPVSSHKYLLSKITPYVTIAVFQLVLLYVVGILLYGIKYQINMFLILLLSIFFVIACAMLGMLCSLCKSQIVSTLLQICCVIFPLYILSISYLESSPIFIQLMLYVLPTALFPEFLRGMMFSGVVLWWVVLALILQSAVYYIISYIIVRKRARS